MNLFKVNATLYCNTAIMPQVVPFDFYPFSIVVEPGIQLFDSCSFLAQSINSKFVVESYLYLYLQIMATMTIIHK